jgi:hypothetical protein
MPEHGPGKSPKIFLSYRRGDAGGDAGRLRDTLRQRLGSEASFYDLDGIAPGENWAAKLTEALDASDILLAIIGPGWETAKSAGGTSLSDRNDWVRRELIAGLKSDRLRVVPILVNRDMPEARSLPAALRPLATRNAYAIRRERWSVDVDELLRQLGVSRRDASDGEADASRKQATLVSVSIEWKRTERPDPTPRRWVVYIRNASDGPIYVDEAVVTSPGHERQAIEWGTVEPGATSDYEMDEAQFDPSGAPPKVSIFFRDGGGQRWRLREGRLQEVRP